MAFPNDIQSNTPKPYQFKLTSSTGSVICNKDPLEWKEGVLEISRNLEVGGIFTSFMVDSLTFVGNGAKFLSDLWDLFEINAECQLHIYYFDFIQRTYIEFPNSFAAKFISYKKVKIGKFAIGINIEFINTSNNAKLIDRKGVSIDITRYESIGGLTLLEFPGFPALSKVKFPALSNSYNAKLLQPCLKTTDPLYFFYGIYYGYNSVPLTIVNNDFSEVCGVNYEYGQAAITDLGAVFRNASEAKTLHCRFDCYVMVDNGFGILYPDALDFRYAVYNGETQISDNSVTSTGWTNPFGQNTSPVDSPRNIKGSFDVSLAEGESLYFYVYKKAPDIAGMAHFVKHPDPSIPNGCILQISQSVVNTSEVIVDGFPIYEAFERTLQMILDTHFPFYSEFFGRTDSPYTFTPDYYDSEADERFAHVMSGINIRGNTIFDSESKINLTFEKLFKSASALYCLGYSFETIEGTERLRIENFGYFFNDTEIMDLSDRVMENDIEMEYISELAYVQILTGFENFVYRSTNGRGEYNTENSRTTILNTPNELNIKSEMRCDTTGIVNCLEKPTDTYGSEDIDEDNDVFIVKTQRDSDTDHEWLVETDELISVENNSSMFGDSSLNLYFTPTRNLIRNAEIFTPALQKQLSSKIRFQTSGKLSNLETSGEGYADNVIENEDLSILRLNSINLPKFKPIKHTVTCRFTIAEITTLMGTGTDGVLNRYKKIKLTDSISGYILNIKKKNAEDKATIELIESV